MSEKILIIDDDEDILIDYVEKNRVEIFGGSGFDTVVVAGTALDDDFYIFTDNDNRQYLYGAGLKLENIDGIERLGLSLGLSVAWVPVLALILGVIGVAIRRNLIVMLMSIELMLNAVNLNLVAFWRYLTPDRSTGMAWAVFVLAVAAAEAAVGLALIISVYRTNESVVAEELDTLKN